MLHVLRDSNMYNLQFTLLTLSRNPIFPKYTTLFSLELNTFKNEDSGHCIFRTPQCQPNHSCSLWPKEQLEICGKFHQ